MSTHFGRVILVLGGARSGKSAVAERTATAAGGPVTYIATGQATDPDMAARIKKHRARREPSWQTLEEPRDPAAAVRRAGAVGRTCLLDGVGTWVTNLLLAAVDESAVLAAVDDLLAAAAETGARLVLVSDETGLGVVPATALGRRFRDLLGTVNQRLAAAADSVLWVVAGLAVDLRRLSLPEHAVAGDLGAPAQTSGGAARAQAGDAATRAQADGATDPTQAGDADPAAPRRSGARAIMVQGTASNVGKSLLVTALCRILREDGYRVAPFKSQNMSNNSYITAGGLEVGRAQGVQAEAAGVEAIPDMNPVLLKPSGAGTSQVIIHGRPYAELHFRDYRSRAYAPAAAAIRASLDRLRAEYEIIVIEGAGSPAEVNLKEKELVNMRIAAWADAPVLLVGDIDRGGVLAALVGTLDLLEPPERDRVAGLVINNFRGDPGLLEPALTFLAERTGKPVLGVIPHLDIDLEAEDSLALPAGGTAAAIGTAPASGTAPGGGAGLRICVLRLPHISNFTDLDPLRRSPGVQLVYVDRPDRLRGADAVVLPGTKNTAADLQWLWETGLAAAIRDLAGGGCPVVGICGGFQMLGRRVADPVGAESPYGETPGLGLLDVETVFAAPADKVTRRTRGRLVATDGPFARCRGAMVAGYEIHMGRTRLGPQSRPLLAPDGGDDSPGRADEPCPGPDGAGEAPAAAGAATPGGEIWGTYLHDIFHNDALRESWLRWLWEHRGLTPPSPAAAGDAAAVRAVALAELAAAVREHLDMAGLYRVLGLPGPKPAGDAAGPGGNAGPGKAVAGQHGNAAAPPEDHP